MVINAMIGMELLPSSMGHTTNCFLQIEEARDDDAACDPNVPREGARLPSFSEVGSHFIIRRSQFASESTTNGAMSYEENSIIPLDIPVGKPTFSDVPITIYAFMFSSSHYSIYVCSFSLNLLSYYPLSVLMLALIALFIVKAYERSRV